jgi:hypothetical protein
MRRFAPSFMGSLTLTICLVAHSAGAGHALRLSESVASGFSRKAAAVVNPGKCLPNPPRARKPATQTQASPVNRFEKNVAAYEAADKASPPPQGAILLLGDSQFYRWKTLAEDLPGYTITRMSCQARVYLSFMRRSVASTKGARSDEAAGHG